MAQYTPNKNIPSIYRPKVMEGSVEQDAIENHENRIQKTESHVDFSGPADSTHHAHLAEDIWVESYSNVDGVTHTAATVQAFVDQCHVNLSTHSRNKNTSAVHLTDDEKTNVNNHVQNTGIHFTDSTEKQEVLEHTTFTRTGTAPDGKLAHNATEIHISRQPGVLPSSGLSGRLKAMQDSISASKHFVNILEPVNVKTEGGVTTVDRSTMGQIISFKKIRNNLVSQVYPYTLNGQTIKPAILKWNLWKATITEELYEITGYVYQISPDIQCRINGKMDVVIHISRNFIIRRLLFITVDGDFTVRPVGKLYECSNGDPIIVPVPEEGEDPKVTGTKSQYRVHLTTDTAISPFYPDGFVIKIVAIGEYIPVYCWKNKDGMLLYTASETPGVEAVTYMSALKNGTLIPDYGIAALFKKIESGTNEGRYNASRCWVKKYYIKSYTIPDDDDTDHDVPYIEVYPNAIDDNVELTTTEFSRHTDGDLKPDGIEFDENVLS